MDELPEGWSKLDDHDGCHNFQLFFEDDIGQALIYYNFDLRTTPEQLRKSEVELQESQAGLMNAMFGGRFVLSEIEEGIRSSCRNVSLERRKVVLSRWRILQTTEIDRRVDVISLARATITAPRTTLVYHAKLACFTLRSQHR